MTQQMNYEMQVYNIKQFLVNNGYDPEQIDVAAHVDPTLSLTENKKLFATKLNIPMNQMGGGLQTGSQQRYMQQPKKKAKQEADQVYCDYLADNCESNCNNNACKAFRKTGCSGEVEPCKPSRYTKTARRKSAPIFGDCDVVEYCVQAHTRPPQHNSRTGLPITVSGYCVTGHKRLCRRAGNG
jgi:hypothetical protein